MTAPATRLLDYALCLRNSVYAFMWLAECTKQAGNWFTFVAAYATIAELSGDDAALHTALFLVCRRLPYLLLFPLTGLAADRLNRGALLVVACLVQSAVSFTLPLVRLRGQIELLYPLILLQYSAQAFYDPARISSVPTVVPAPLLCVASTLDLMGFSLMAIFGAAMAGRTAAAYGTAVCFRVEGCTFLLAAALLLRLAGVTLSGARQTGRGAAGRAAARRASTAAEDQEVDEEDERALLKPNGHHMAKPADADAGGAAADDDQPPELQPLLAAGGRRGARDRGCVGCGALSYMAERRNWDVAVLVWCKSTGALAWGAADVLNGRFSRMSSMQALGGPDLTLGAILAAVGLGSVLGPLIANALTPGVGRWWRVSITAAFALLSAGYALMASASSIGAVLPATAIRTSGSATLYIHSTATLQHRLSDAVRGRLFAVEFVLWTVAEATSTLFGGYALDALGWSTSALSSGLAALAACFAVCWGFNAWLLWDDKRGELQEALLAAAADGPRSVVVGGQGA